MARALVAAFVACGAFWPGPGRAQPETAGVILAAVQGEVVVVEAGGAARLGAIGMPIGAGDRVDHEEKESVARGGPEGVQVPPPVGVLPPIPTLPVPAPPHDRFASATALGVPGSARTDTGGATSEPGEPRPTCGPVANTVWYTLTPSAPRSVTITTEGSTYDTILAVYTGSSLATLTQLACNDQDPDLTAGPGTSKVGLTLTPGQVYVVQVGGARGAGGTLVVTVR